MLAQHFAGAESIMAVAQGLTDKQAQGKGTAGGSQGSWPILGFSAGFLGKGSSSWSPSGRQVEGKERVFEAVETGELFPAALVHRWCIAGAS